MAVKKKGGQTLVFAQPPVITNTFSIVGPEEGKGPLTSRFDTVLDDDYYGEKTWEKAETKMVGEAIQNVIKKASLQPQDLDFIVAGDLLDQIVASNFAIREFPVSFFGLYGACSTMAEGLALGAILVDGGYADRVVACGSSHHDTAERQYRFPTEMGVQRRPTAQWTVTGAGSALVQKMGQGPRISSVTLGKIVDMGSTDANDMGTAMAPAAVDTILQHFTDLGVGPQDYDLIVTGDLGRVGVDIAKTLFQQQNVDMGLKFNDCGLMIYSPEQDVHAGASGCGCSAVVFCGHLYKEMQEGKNRRVLLVGTGALLSPLTTLQKESIPSIAHAIDIQI